MKKEFKKLLWPGILAMILAMSSFQVNAQWLIYYGDVHPFETEGAIAPLLDISEHSEKSPAETLIDVSMNDPAIVGNRIFKYFHFDGDGKTMYRHNFADEAVGTHMTMVARVKGSGSTDPEVRAIDLQWRGAEFRDELRIWPGDSIIELEKAGVEVKVDMNLNDWHIYRMEIMNDSVTVFMDEDPVPVVAGKSGSSTSSRYIKFGDGSSDPTAGYMDWFVFYMDGAYTPEGMALPADLTGQGNDVMRSWAYYTGDVLPPDNDPVFVESNTGGDAPVNEIMVDPDDAANNLLKLVVAGDDSKWMWKLSDGWDVDPAEAVTVIARVMAVSDTLDRTMELDLHANGLRERLYLKNDGTYELKETKIKADGPDMMRWHTVRLTLENGEVNAYMDENPMPFASGTSTTSTSSSYLRFGDGNGSSSLGGYVDYVVWTTDGAFPPDSIGVPLELKVDEYVPWDRDLVELAADVGTMEPEFASDETDYTVTVPAGTAAVNFTATASDTLAVITGDLMLDAIPGTAIIIVTAQDGSMKDYDVDVVLEPSSVASLSALSVDVGTLDPAFAEATTAYALEVPSGTTAVNISATATDANAAIAGDGEFSTIPGMATVTVTAEDGVSTMDYTIDITISSVGVEQISLTSALVYPNPASQYVMVSLNELYLGSELKVIDASGRVIHRELYRSANQRVDLSEQAAGFYHLSIEKEGNNAKASFIIE